MTPEPKPRRRAGRRCATLAAGLSVLLGMGWAAAHEPGADALPDAPGWRVGAAAAVLAVEARQPWPTPQWPGVLIYGSAPRDQRGGLHVEHVTVDAAARISERWGAHVALGVHDRDRAHVEAARLQARWEREDDEFQLGLGRDTVRMGAPIDGAGHFDRFSQAPMAKRAVLNDMWADDGASFAWRRAVERGLRGVELGLWRGQAFPGGPRGKPVPTVHLQLGWDHLDVHVFSARLQPEGRGAAVMSAGASGHLHSSPDCRASLRQLVCFDGRVDVLGGSLQWAPEDSALTLSVAGLARRERGALYSLSGDADYRAKVKGVWADAAWQFDDRWAGALRLERLVPGNSLTGVGATLVSREAGLAQGGPVNRWTASLLHTPFERFQVALEGGTESGVQGRSTHVAIRLIWRHPELLGAGW
jgi:hypothetical protein